MVRKHDERVRAYTRRAADWRLLEPCIPSKSADVT